MIDDKTPILADTTAKSDDPPINIDVIPEAKAPELRYSVRKNAAIINEPENNSKKQSSKESEADIKVSLMVICCPCPETECKESDKCECDKCECDKCECDKCECDKCECDKCECKKSNKCEQQDKSCCLEHFPFFTNLCTCFGQRSIASQLLTPNGALHPEEFCQIPKDFAQTHPQVSK